MSKTTIAVVLGAILVALGSWYVPHLRQRAAAKREAELSAREAYAAIRARGKAMGGGDADFVEQQRRYRAAFIQACRACAEKETCEATARALDSRPEDAVMWVVCK